MYATRKRLAFLRDDAAQKISGRRSMATMNAAGRELTAARQGRRDAAAEQEKPYVVRTINAKGEPDPKPVEASGPLAGRFATAAEAEHRAKDLAGHNGGYNPTRSYAHGSDAGDTLNVIHGEQSKHKGKFDVVKNPDVRQRDESGKFASGGG